MEASKRTSPMLRTLHNVIPPLDITALYPIMLWPT